MRHDEASTIVQPAPGAVHLTVQQAIFTSVFSRVARGYRLVACSHGVSADERKELLQLCPSHGSLLDDGPGAEGFASLLLRSGRRCILLARHAGEEYSGRGGQRVHTHVLILDADDFAILAHDPLRVAAAARDHIRPEWLDAPPAELDALTLAAPSASCRPAAPRTALSADESRALEAAAGALFESRNTIVADDDRPARSLMALLAALPTWRRGSLTLSRGLRPAAARPVQLLFLNAAPVEIERTRVQCDATVIHWPRTPVSTRDEAEHCAATASPPRPSAEMPPSAGAGPEAAAPVPRPRPLLTRAVLRATPPPRPVPRPVAAQRVQPPGASARPDANGGAAEAARRAPSARPAEFAEWLDFCTTHWRRGDLASLFTVSDAFVQRSSAPALQRILELTSALDQVATADTADLERFHGEFARDAHCAGPQGDLARRLLTAIAARTATGWLRSNREDEPEGPAPRGFYF